MDGRGGAGVFGIFTVTVRVMVANLVQETGFTFFYQCWLLNVSAQHSHSKLILN